MQDSFQLSVFSQKLLRNYSAPDMKIILFAIILAVVSPAVAQRSIAITIDDLPVVTTRQDLKSRQEITRKLLGHIKNIVFRRSAS